MKSSSNPNFVPRSNHRAVGDRRFRWMLGAYILWLSFVLMLGAWWGRLVLAQAKRIADLEEAAGVAADVTRSHWHRTERMLYWESSTFFTLFFISTLVLFWLFWRDAQRARGIQAFFASVTHELRTPLTSVRLQAETIAEKWGEKLGKDGQPFPFIDRLLEDTHRLEGQVERTLELARLEGGGPVFTQTLEIKPFLDRFVKNWSGDSQLKVVIESSIEDRLVEADPTAVQIILKNVLENSIRHASADPVQVLISGTSEVGAKESSFVLSVRDNGSNFRGIPAQLGVLFQKGALSQGTGVGLYLVKTLMKKMRGSVRFSTQDGFEVLLKFREGSAAHDA